MKIRIKLVAAIAATTNDHGHLHGEAAIPRVRIKRFAGWLAFLRHRSAKLV